MSNAMTEPPTSGWSVTGQVQYKQLNSQGLAVDGWRVSFQTANGTVGSVWLPLADYNADSVRAAIVAQVVKLDAVAGLSG